MTVAQPPMTHDHWCAMTGGARLIIHDRSTMLSRCEHKVTASMTVRGGRMRQTNLDKSRQPRRWKPLTQAQENALLLLIQGKSDGEVAADPGVQVTRQTVWEWRHHDPRFAAELERLRAEV